MFWYLRRRIFFTIHNTLRTEVRWFKHPWNQIFLGCCFPSKITNLWCYKPPVPLFGPKNPFPNEILTRLVTYWKGLFTTNPEFNECYFPFQCHPSGLSTHSCVLLAFVSTNLFTTYVLVLICTTCWTSDSFGSTLKSLISVEF